MARESTIELTFELEKANPVPIALVSPGVTKGATTTVHISPSDPVWSMDPDIIYGGQLFTFGTGTNGTGWQSLDGKMHRATSVDATSGTIILETDTSAETTAVAAFANIDFYDWSGYSHVCLTAFSVAAATAAEVDSTTMCDAVRVNLPGLPTSGTSSFTGIFDLEDTGMVALMEAYNDKVPRFFVGRTRRGQLFIFHGIVSGFSVGDLSVEVAITFTGSFTLDAAPAYMKPYVAPEGLLMAA